MDSLHAPTEPADLDAQALGRLVEQLILEQQGLDPFELLLAAGILAYPDYEAWRMGRRAELQSALRLGAAETAVLLADAARQAEVSGLLARDIEHRRWSDDEDGARTPLSIGTDPTLRRAVAKCYQPPPRDRQLDLFYDGGAVALEQSLRDALAERRLADARAACARLLERGSDGAAIADWLSLIDALDSSGDSPARVPCSAEEAAARLEEVDRLVPIARRRLGYRARDLLAVLWNDLAQQFQSLRFNADAPRLHASWVLSQLERWADARAAIEAEPTWRAEPLLLARHSAVCRRGGDRTAALKDWFALCWLHPDAADRVLGAADLPDKALAARWSEFCDLDPPAPPLPALETEDFPAWCLLADPGLAASAPPAANDADPDRADAYAAVQALIMEPADLDRRRRLGDAHPTLLATFLERLRRA
jgi:hypothetical protein